MKVLSELDNSPRASTAWVTATETTDVAPVPAKSENLAPQTKADRRVTAKSRQSVELKQNVRSSQVTDQSSRETNPNDQKIKTNDSVMTANQPYVDKIEVSIELLSNWDHPRFIGLTEMELIDAAGQKIEIVPSTDVLSSVSLSDGSRNDIGVLFNGKSKVREKLFYYC